MSLSYCDEHGLVEGHTAMCGACGATLCPYCNEEVTQHSEDKGEDDA